jgi:hypothetical protein
MDTLFSRFRGVRSGVGGLSSFFSGFVSAFNLRGEIDVPDWSHGPERDAEAWARDWANIGADFRRAMDRVDSK